MTSITMRIFVMGLVAVLNRDGGGVDILLPAAGEHLPILAFTCDNQAGCGPNTKEVWNDLQLPPENLDCNSNLLAFGDDSRFGAVELKDTKSIRIRITPDPVPVRAAGSKTAGRHHQWPMSMWYHMAGEVPQTEQEAKDASWLVSLKDILPCATPKALCEMTGDGTLAAYLSSSTAMGDPIVASLSGMYEYTKGRCKSAGEDSTQQYAVTLNFNPSSPLTRQDQAAADALYYQVTVDAPVKIYLDTSAATPIVITPYAGTGSVDILIANLTVFDGSTDACPPDTAAHGELYIPLLHLSPECSFPKEVKMGWESTRTPKVALGNVGNTLPDILGVVSVKNPGKGRKPLIPTEGAARNLCYMLTN